MELKLCDLLLLYLSVFHVSNISNFLILLDKANKKSTFVELKIFNGKYSYFENSRTYSYFENSRKYSYFENSRGMKLKTSKGLPLSIPKGMELSKSKGLELKASKGMALKKSNGMGLSKMDNYFKFNEYERKRKYLQMGSHIPNQSKQKTEPQPAHNEPAAPAVMHMNCLASLLRTMSIFEELLYV